MSQAVRDAGSESGENCDNFALFAPRDELPTIAGGNRAREQCTSHQNLPDTGSESEPEHDVIMIQAGKDSRPEGDSVEPIMGETCDIVSLSFPWNERPAIGGEGAREQHSSRPNLPGIENESEPEHDSSQPADESESGEEEEEEEEGRIYAVSEADVKKSQIGSKKGRERRQWTKSCPGKMTPIYSDLFLWVRGVE